MSSPLRFIIEKKGPGLARVGRIETAHGVIETPAFTPVGTKASVRAIAPDALASQGVQALIANTYHLFMSPGYEVVAKAGGLHSYMRWPHPILTDSGGFQVFSLGAAYGKSISKVVKAQEDNLLPSRTADDEERPKIVSIDADGAAFKSPRDGTVHYFTPERSMEIQHGLGADIMFAFDECTSPTESLAYQKESLDRTHRWARRSLDYHKSKPNAETQALYGIVQGGRFEELRKESARVIGAMDFDGYGIGGSYTKEQIEEYVRWINEILPEEKPRHLLGIGEPEDLFAAVESGCDTFDCVNPTRLGRHGTLYTRNGKIHITNAQYAEDFQPIDPDCGCDACRGGYSRSYLAHLHRTREMLGPMLCSIHNIYFITQLARGMRQALLDDKLSEYKTAFFARYKKDAIE